MIVIIAGMQRSGSTFSFNVARDLLLESGSVAQASASSLPPIQEREITTHFLLKTHGPDAEVRDLIASGAAKAICTYRRPEDAVASWMEVFGFDLEHGISTMRAWMQWHRDQEGAMLNLSWETIEYRPMEAIAAIQSHLYGHVDNARTASLATRHAKRATLERVAHMKPDEHTVDIGFTYYDAATFYHRRHIRSVEAMAADATLSPSQIDRIRQELSEFTTDTNDYLLPRR